VNSGQQFFVLLKNELCFVATFCFNELVAVMEKVVSVTWFLASNA
jgi:hypothetical protein